jgi:hypothetical protein
MTPTRSWPILALALALLAPIACGKALDGGSNEVVFIRQALAPPPPASRGSPSVCHYPADKTAASLSQAWLDVGVRSDYHAELLAETTQTGSGVNLSGGHTRVTFPDGTLVGEFDFATSAFVDEPGVGVIDALLIDGETAMNLRGMVPADHATTREVVADVTITGHAAPDGPEVVTPSFRMPILVCNGCLVVFPDQSRDPIGPQPNCLKPFDPSDPAATAPCFPGQDEQTTCQLCQPNPMCDPSKR